MRGVTKGMQHRDSVCVGADLGKWESGVIEQSEPTWRSFQGAENYRSRLNQICAGYVFEEAKHSISGGIVLRDRVGR